MEMRRSSYNPLTGGITTNEDKHKWGSIASPQCAFCHDRDTIWHRFSICQAYQESEMNTKNSWWVYPWTNRISLPSNPPKLWTVDGNAPVSSGALLPENHAVLTGLPDLGVDWWILHPYRSMYRLSLSLVVDDFPSQVARSSWLQHNDPNHDHFRIFYTGKLPGKQCNSRAEL